MSRNVPNVSEPRRPPEKVMSTTRVNVAFPFSSVRIQEPSEHIIALTALLHDMALLMAEIAPGESSERLTRRAEELLGQVR